MRAQLLHLSGPLRGNTITYEGPIVHIGSHAENEARINAHGVAARHAQIEFVPDECAFYLQALDGQVFVNGDEVTEAILSDDDRIEFGVDGPKARFRIYVPAGAVCKPVHRMLADARDVASHCGGAVATRTLTRDLLTQATTTLKIGFPTVIVLSAFLAGWLGGWIGSRPSDEDRARTANMVTRAELDELRAQQVRQQEAMERYARVNSSVYRIQKEWSRGVCLVHGAFRVRMPDNTWYTRHSSEPYEREYTGSGFRATEAGHVITNRHVLAPWREVVDLRPVIDGGGVPEFVLLTATFPGMAPLDVPVASILLRDDDLDVGVFKLDSQQLEGVPSLPLRTKEAESEDQRAIVVGYPTGLAALIARADPALADGLRERSATYAEAIAALAAAGQITPTITQGVVSNVQKRIITYDASTTYGGSGGPVFGAEGEVIAVNFAILPGFAGANSGVPIVWARELLPE